MSDATDPAVGVTIAAEHLPGLMEEIAGMVERSAGALSARLAGVPRAGCPVHTGLLDGGDAHVSARNTLVLLMLVRQLGWQTDRDATVVGGADEIRQTFEAIRSSARRGLGSVATVPVDDATDDAQTVEDIERALDQALGACADVLDQLERCP